MMRTEFSRDTYIDIRNFINDLGMNRQLGEDLNSIVSRIMGKLVSKTEFVSFSICLIEKLDNADAKMKEVAHAFFAQLDWDEMMSSEHLKDDKEIYKIAQWGELFNKTSNPNTPDDQKIIQNWLDLSSQDRFKRSEAFLFFFKKYKEVYLESAPHAYLQKDFWSQLQKWCGFNTPQFLTALIHLCLYDIACLDDKSVVERKALSCIKKELEGAEDQDLLYILDFIKSNLFRYKWDVIKQCFFGNGQISSFVKIIKKIAIQGKGKAFRDAWEFVIDVLKICDTAWHLETAPLVIEIVKEKKGELDALSDFVREALLNKKIYENAIEALLELLLKLKETDRSFSGPRTISQECLRLATTKNTRTTAEIVFKILTTSASLPTCQAYSRGLYDNYIDRIENKNHIAYMERGMRKNDAVSLEKPPFYLGEVALTEENIKTLEKLVKLAELMEGVKKACTQENRQKNLEEIKQLIDEDSFFTNEDIAYSTGLILIEMLKQARDGDTRSRILELFNSYIEKTKMSRGIHWILLQMTRKAKDEKTYAKIIARLPYFILDLSRHDKEGQLFMELAKQIKDQQTFQRLLFSFTDMKDSETLQYALSSVVLILKHEHDSNLETWKQNLLFKFMKVREQLEAIRNAQNKAFYDTEITDQMPFGWKNLS